MNPDILKESGFRKGLYSKVPTLPFCTLRATVALVIYDAYGWSRHGFTRAPYGINRRLASYLRLRWPASMRSRLASSVSTRHHSPATITLSKLPLSDHLVKPSATISRPGIHLTKFSEPSSIKASRSVAASIMILRSEVIASLLSTS